MTYPCFRFARWKYEGFRYFTRFNTLFESLFNRVRADLVGTGMIESIRRDLLNQQIKKSEGSERPSISASLFKNSEYNQLSTQEMAWSPGHYCASFLTFSRLLPEPPFS